VARRDEIAALQQREPATGSLGAWFISTSLANLGSGPVASRIEAIERGEIVLPWHLGGQAYAEATLRPGLLRCCAAVVDDPNRS